MRKKRSQGSVGVLAVVIVIVAAFAFLVIFPRSINYARMEAKMQKFRREHTAAYNLVTHQEIEIRDYDPMIVAELTVTDEQQMARETGRSAFEDYLSGKNDSAQKLALYLPMMQQISPGTAPIWRDGKYGEKIQEGSWNMRLILRFIDFEQEKTYESQNIVTALETFPRPTNQAINLRQLAAKRFVVTRFKRIERDESQRIDDLKAFIKARGFKSLSEPIYNSYFQDHYPPWMCCDEVMIEVAK
jgi:hypothetical protein